MGFSEDDRIRKNNIKHNFQPVVKKLSKVETLSDIEFLLHVIETRSICNGKLPDAYDKRLKMLQNMYCYDTEHKKKWSAWDV